MLYALHKFLELQTRNRRFFTGPIQPRQELLAIKKLPRTVVFYDNKLWLFDTFVCGKAVATRGTRAAATD
jgi:hypothetical protein